MFALGFSFEGIHENDQVFRTCMPLNNGTPIVLSLDTSDYITDWFSYVNTFILYEYDVVVQEGVVFAVNKLYSPLTDPNFMDHK